MVINVIAAGKFCLSLTKMSISFVAGVMMFSLARLYHGYLFVVIIICIDQITKLIMLDLIFDPPRIISILPFLNLAPVYNTGASFGLLGHSGFWGLVMLTGLAVAVGVLLPFIARNWLLFQRWGAIMMAGGALGNAIDRLQWGKVVDFIDVHVGGWHWPAFNVADSAIVIGVGCILYGTWRHDHEETA
jgi:signal peptidase II